MHSRLLVSGLPRSLPPLPRSLVPPCLPCVEGWQRTAPQSSSFPLTTTPLQTLHMDLRRSAVFLIRWIHAVPRQLSARFQQELPVLRLHSDRGGEFSSGLLEDLCGAKGIRQTFTLPASPQQNGIAECRIGLGMEAARTSIVHAAAPHFLWLFAFQYATKKLNLWPVSPTQRPLPLCGGRARLVMCRRFGSGVPFRLFAIPPRGSSLPAIFAVTSLASLPKPRAGSFTTRVLIVFSPPRTSHLTSLSASTISTPTAVPPCPSHLSHWSPPPPPPPVAPLPPQGPAPSGVSQGALSLEQLREWAVQWGSLGGGASRLRAGGAGTAGAGGAGWSPGGGASRAHSPRAGGTGGAGPTGGPGGTGTRGTTRGTTGGTGGTTEGAESGGAEPRGTASSGGAAGASPRLSPWPEPLSPQPLREWSAQRTRLRSGATGAGDSAAGDTGAGAAGPGGACTRGTGAAGTGGVAGAGARDPTEPGAAEAGGAGAVGAGAGGTGAGGAGAGRAGVVDPGARGAGSTMRPRPYFVPLLQQVLGVPSSTGLTPPILCPPPDQTQPPLQPASPLPAPSPYTEQTGGLTEHREPASRPLVVAYLVRVTHAMALCPSSELVYFAAACRLDYATAFVAESESASPPSVGGECALGTDVLEDRHEDFECLAPAVPRFASMLLAPEGDPDAPDILTPRSYAEAITGPYSSQWQAAMDAEMASWKSTGTYVDAAPPSGTNIVDGMWIFRVKRPPGSPPAFKARYAARGFRQRQGVDYFQTYSPTPKKTTLRGSLHEEIWLRRPPSFTGSFSAGTQWSLRRPVYGLRQAPREWHDTLRTTLVALGFIRSTADPSLFLPTDTSLPPFYVLVYVDDLVFATADTEALTLVKFELLNRHTCTDLDELRSYLGLQITRERAQRTITLTQSHMLHQVLQCFGFQFFSPQPTPLSTSHSLSAPPSDKSVEPSGPYPELVGCLMYLMTCTRPELAYPLSLLARYVAPGRHQKMHQDAAKRVLRYLCSTSGMGIVLGGRGPVVLTGHTDASWVHDSAMQRSSQGHSKVNKLSN
ncbi:unnamed protein product [Closterium sp. NIES-53]